MKSFRVRSSDIESILIYVLALITCSCQTSQKPNELSNRPPAQPINSVKIGSFRCSNEITGQAVRNVFVERLVHFGDVKVLEEGNADIVIEGTVTLANGDSSSGRIGGGQSIIVGRSQHVAGDYVSGVTAVASRNGEILTSASWGQNFGKGEALLPPESVARRAADRLLDELVREGLKRR